MFTFVLVKPVLTLDGLYVLQAGFILADKAYIEGRNFTLINPKDPDSTGKNGEANQANLAFADYLCRELPGLKTTIGMVNDEGPLLIGPTDKVIADFNERDIRTIAVQRDTGLFHADYERCFGSSGSPTVILSDRELDIDGVMPALNPTGALLRYINMFDYRKIFGGPNVKIGIFFRNCDALAPIEIVIRDREALVKVMELITTKYEANFVRSDRGQRSSKQVENRYQISYSFELKELPSDFGLVERYLAVQIV